MIIRLLTVTGLSLLIPSLFAKPVVIESLIPSYPQIPSAYETLSTEQLINDARVNFDHAFVIGSTNGYQVTDPFGNKFVVDDIDQPKCAFYGTYVTADNEIGSAAIEVNSNIYVEEINFDGCQ